MSEWPGDVIDRFVEQVDFDGPDGCWLWTGNVAANGYGHVYIWLKAKRTARKAHRVAWTEFVGPVPDGLELDHLCRNRVCVNPDHLEPVSHRENSLRGVGQCALNARKTHCPLGHPYSPENTSMEGTSRRCLTCKRRLNRESYARKKQR